MKQTSRKLHLNCHNKVDEPVGFATKITEAGPHNLSFYVTDSYGNKSNVVKATMTVEPADGNKRPKCVLQTTVGPI